MVKTAMKRASQERLGHGTRKSSKTLSRTTPPTGVSEESSARARTWTDCHNAVLCLESAMTLVTASCPFQRARPLQCDYGQEPSTHHPPSSSAACGEVLRGVWWTLPKVGTTLFFTWCSCVKEPHATKTVRTSPPPGISVCANNVALCQAKAPQLQHQGLQHLPQPRLPTSRLQQPCYCPVFHPHAGGSPPSL